MFNSVKTVIHENWVNRKRMVRLANYELKSQNYGTVLGFMWNFLNPALQIFVYWFVFAIGLRQDAPKGDYPYIVWMITGIIPWFYISNAMQATSSSIYAYSGVLKRMKFPMAIVPVKTVVAQFLGHIWAMLVVIAMMMIYKVRFSLHNIQVVYFMFCGLCFLISFSLIVSAITVLLKDFQKILSSIIRLLFYISPIVWSPDSLPEKFSFVFKLNPLYYVIEGYRESLLYNYGLWYHGKQMVYFWTVSILMFLYGCYVHIKLRKHFIDLI